MSEPIIHGVVMKSNNVPHIKYEEWDAEGGTKDTVYKGNEPAHPDLLKALNQLRLTVIRVCRLGEEWSSPETTVSITDFNQKDSEQGSNAIIGITGVFEDAVVKHKQSIPFDSLLLSDQETISKLLIECAAYIDGKRGNSDQMNLFDQAA